MAFINTSAWVGNWFNVSKMWFWWRLLIGVKGMTLQHLFPAMRFLRCANDCWLKVRSACLHLIPPRHTIFYFQIMAQALHLFWLQFLHKATFLVLSIDCDGTLWRWSLSLSSSVYGCKCCFKNLCRWWSVLDNRKVTRQRRHLKKKVCKLHFKPIFTRCIEPHNMVIICKSLKFDVIPKVHPHTHLMQ